jgi:hypothetical protein
MKQPLSERWVEWVGRQTVAVPGGSWVCVAMAVMFAVLGYQIYQQQSRSLDPCQLMVRDAYALAQVAACLGLLWAALASFERAAFYRIVERQRARIRELEGRAASPGGQQ